MPKKHIFYQKPMDSRRMGIPQSRFKYHVEENLRKQNIRDWKARAHIKEEWSRQLEQAKTHQVL